MFGNMQKTSPVPQIRRDVFVPLARPLSWEKTATSWRCAVVAFQSEGGATLVTRRLTREGVWRMSDSRCASLRNRSLRAMDIPEDLMPEGILFQNGEVVAYAPGSAEQAEIDNIAMEIAAISRVLESLTPYRKTPFPAFAPFSAREGGEEHGRLAANGR